MTKMHENELEIDEALVRVLLQEQCPQWADLHLQRVKSSGTDNALFRLGDDYVVRLPRIGWAVDGINKEYEWVPRLARCLKMPVSEPVFKGGPNEQYSSAWMITKWNDGHNPDFEKEDEYEVLAKDMAGFLNELHGIKLAGGPASRRGVPLNQLDEQTMKAIGELEGEIGIPAITSLWEQLSNIPSWDKESVWVHGDFLPGNILVQNNRLSAVIDFSDVGIGDPACDLVIAWSLLNANSRDAFKQHLQGIDENTWQRGRGWALSIALIMLPYYKYTNPVLARLARRIIANVL